MEELQSNSNHWMKDKPWNECRHGSFSTSYESNRVPTCPRKKIALFAWLISHDWKYCRLIYCEKKILFVGWKSTAYKSSEQGDTRVEEDCVCRLVCVFPQGNERGSSRPSMLNWRPTGQQTRFRSSLCLPRQRGRPSRFNCNLQASPQELARSMGSWSLAWAVTPIEWASHTPSLIHAMRPFPESRRDIKSRQGSSRAWEGF